MFDIIIKNGRVVNGSGNTWFWGDIGIKGGKIKRIGQINRKAKRIFDAAGLVVCPGFIDMHSHSDMKILINPRALNKIMQGVTTEVTGNCGTSPAPVDEATIDQLKASLGYAANAVDWNWRSLGEYYNRVKRVKSNGLLVNIAPLVGQGTIRIAVMGFADRPPRPEEMGRMKGFLQQAMEEGAFGLSTGLIYPPGSFTETAELIELAKVLKEYDGLYASHVRGESSTLIDAVKEAINIGKEAEVKVEISHHKACGKRNWGKVKQTLRLIESARNEGIDVTCDQYPYTASSTGLSACLPPWVHEGGVERLLERLKDPATRIKIKQDIENKKDWDNVIMESGCDNIVVASINSKANKDLEGKTLARIAQLQEKDPFDTLFDLLLQEKGDVSIVIFEMNEDDLRMVMKHPTMMVGSDGSSLSPSLPEGKPHPRNYGTYPRVLGKYVREEKVLTLEAAIRKMTSFPAQKLGIKNRGLLAEGYWADIVVFDPEVIRDTATYEQPHHFPEGIEYVFVNGELVVEKGEYTGAVPGEVLQRN